MVASANENGSTTQLQSQKSEAMKLFKQGQYEPAYQLFSKLYLSVLSDVNVNFFLGRSAYETGRYEIALAAFERVDTLEPTNVRNKLEIARTQYQLKMFEDARLGFEEILSNPSLPDTVRTNIELFVSRIDNQLQKSFFFATAKLGVTYDSNVNYGAFDKTYSLPDYGKFLSNRPSDDFALDIDLALVHIYDIGQKNAFSLRNKLSLFNRTYNTLEEYDITYLSYNPALVYQDLNNIYELNLMIDHMWLHQESYLNSYSVMPNFVHKWDATTRLIAHFKYNIKDFIRPIDEFRGADNYELALAYQKLWSSSYMTLRLSGERERKLQDSARVDVDFDRYRLNFDYTNQFISTYTAKFDAELKQRTYMDYSNLFQNTREDSGYKAGLTLTKKFTPSFYVDVKALYERTWSNQSVYAYEKSTYNLMLNKSF